MNGDLIDAAFGRPWHRADAAAGATDHPAGTPGFQVDLGFRCPIRRVEIAATSASPPRLALSDDGQAWREADLDTARSGPETLVLATGEGAWARHVRVIPDGPAGGESLAARVLCDRADFDLIALRRVLDVPFDMADERPGANPYVSYRLVGAERPRSRALVGLALYECGAFEIGRAHV